MRVVLLSRVEISVTLGGECRVTGVAAKGDRKKWTVTKRAVVRHLGLLSIVENKMATKKKTTKKATAKKTTAKKATAKKKTTKKAAKKK